MQTRASSSWSVRLRGVFAAALFSFATDGPAAAGPVDAEAVAARLADALRFQTISHADADENDTAAFAGFRDFLERSYPRLHTALRREIVNDGALLYTWEGTEAAQAPILLMAHYDVVPIEPGSARKWTRDPFAGEIADGFVWGRGAIDDKGPLILIVEAVESLLAEGFRPAATVYLAFGHDEEVGGLRGAREISALLESRDVRLRYVLDEGGALAQGIVPGLASPLASIGIAEKGYVSFELVATAAGGHSSRPPAETSIGVLAAALDRLQREQMPPRVDGAVRLQLEAIAPHLGLASRLALSNLWLSAPLVTRFLTRDPTSNALARTTTAPTIFEAGVKENVLPSEARAVVNFRILPGDSIAAVEEHVRRVVDDERIGIARFGPMRSEPSPTASVESAAYRALTAAIEELFPDAVVAPSLVIGGTDSRHFTAVADDVYRFIPVRVGPEDLERVHGTDERIEAAALAAGVEFYRRLLRATGTAGDPE